MATSDGSFLGGMPSSYISRERKPPVSQRSILLDEVWAKNTFLTPANESDITVNVKNRTSSTADYKYSDTTMGGSMAINARPQYTRYADPRRKGRIASRNDVTVRDVNGNYGMGRAYSEYLDDAGQPVFMRMGVPEFNSISRFLERFSNPKLVRLATTGRTDTTLGKIIGRGVFWGASIIITNPMVTSMIFLGTTVGHALLGTISNETSKFYQMKKMMPLYWSATSTIVNSLLVNEGVYLTKREQDGDKGKGEAQRNDGMDTEIMRHLHEMMPDVFTVTGGIDVPKLIARHQRNYLKIQDDAFAEYDKGTVEDFVENIVGQGHSDLSDKIARQDADASKTSKQGHSVNQTAEAYSKSPMYRKNETMDSEDGKVKIGNDTQSFFEWTVEMLTGIYNSPTSAIIKHTKDVVFGLAGSIKEGMETEIKDGTAFAVLNVDHTETGTYSFSNTVKDSAIADKYNTASATARDINFDIAGGNLGDGVMAEAIEGISGFFKDMRSGIAEQANSVTFNLTGALENMVNGANAVVPKHWDSSTATLPTASFTTTLVAPYNNFYSRTQNIYIPLAMWLSPALPLQTGSQSYTSPLYMELWQRGKFRIPLGMVTALTISPASLGTGEDKHGRMMGIEVKVTVTDLSPMMPLMIGATWAGNVQEVSDSMTRDNSFSDMLNVLSGSGAAIDAYRTPRVMRNARAKLIALGTSYSIASQSMFWNHELANSDWSIVRLLHTTADLATEGSNKITR